MFERHERSDFHIANVGELRKHCTARDIFAFIREKVSGYKLVRRLEFSDLPKTISGKIRRVELRGQENGRPADGPRSSDEYLEADLR